MQARAATVGADQVLLDLEDATAPSEKPAARQVVVASLREHDYGRRVVSLRVNGTDTPWCYRDVVEVVEAVGDRLETVVLPKVESPADVHFLDRLLAQVERARGWEVGRLGIEVVVESAAGLRRVDEIAAAAARLEALILGPGDLSASLGMGGLTIGAAADAEAGDVWHYAQMRLLVAARAVGALAIDGPYAAFADLEGLARSARRAAALGFDGKWVIHPTQIDTVTAAFTPAAATLARAEGILAAYRAATDGEGRGAAVYQGDMIDEATRKMAEAVVARHRRLVEGD